MPEPARLGDVWRVCNKIRAAAFRSGLDLLAVFLPFDPAREFLLTERDFCAALSQAWVRALVALSPLEISQLADYFREQGGRVQYAHLCRVVRSDPECERVTSAEAPPEKQTREEVVAAEAAARAWGRLDAREERRLRLLLRTVAARDCPLEPYFQDYELVVRADGGMEFEQFARVLSALGVPLSSEDCTLMTRYFMRDRCTVDYHRFLATLRAFVEHGPSVVGGLEEGGSRGGAGEAAGVAAAPRRPSAATPRPAELMRRLQRTVLQRRVRVAELFPDWDPLYSGRVTHQQFARALDALTRGAFTPVESACLAVHYADPNDPARVCWRTFEDDCDRVFAVKELEKHPELDAAGTTRCAVAAAMEASAADASDCALDLLQDALERISNTLGVRALDLRTFFREHDPRRSGRVSGAELGRALARAGPLRLLTAEHMNALQCRYNDHLGFNYCKLLDELDRMGGAHEVNTGCDSAELAATRRADNPDPTHSDILLVLAKLKDKTVREGVRLLDFVRQHDPHNELVVRVPDLTRALDTAGYRLAPRELDTLVQVFASPGRGGWVDYWRLCETITEALTQGGLERAPLLQPVAHVPPAASRAVPRVSPALRRLADKALAKITERPDRLLGIFDLLQESDPVRCGRVTRVQLERALALRGALQAVPSQERDALCTCYAGRPGEINYRELCNTVDVLLAAGSAARAAASIQMQQDNKN